MWRSDSEVIADESKILNKRNGIAMSKKITLDTQGVTISVSAEPEEMDPRKCFDEDSFPFSCLKDDNVWNWCTVFVTVTWEGISATAKLGCCYYQSEADFRNDEAFKDLQEEALDNLNQEIDRINQEIDRLRQLLAKLDAS